MVNIFSESVLTPQIALDLAVLNKAGDKDLKQLMMKTFQKANRRIQNVVNAGLSSPAVQQVIAERGKRDFTYFSGANLDPRNPIDWEQLKYEYGRAIAFLNNPTSSATGARQYIRYMQRELNTTFDGANKIVGLATQPEISENGEVNIFNYSSILERLRGDVMQEQKNGLDNVENYAEELEQKLVNAINAEALKQHSTDFLDRFF